MERCDYRINEDGEERRLSADRVRNILCFLLPYTWEEVLNKMTFDAKPYIYQWGKKTVRIEYKGPNPREIPK